MKRPKGFGYILAIQGMSLVKAWLIFMVFLIAAFTLSGLMTSLKPEYRIASSSLYSAASDINGDLLYYMMGWENHQLLDVLPDRAEPLDLSNLFFRISANVSLDDPRSFLGSELPGFEQFDGKILVAGEGTNYTNMPIESAPPIEVLKAEQEAALQNTDGIEEGVEKAPGAPPNTTGDKKVVYIYFSHTRESYLPYLKGVTNPDSAYHSELNVTKIGDRLKSGLESKGVGTMVDKTDIMAKLNANGQGFGNAYKQSRSVVEAAVAGNRDLVYLIDIHRDSRRKKDTTVSINGQSYAKVAFVIGGKNKNYEENLKLANELHTRLQKSYKGLSRGIIENKGPGMNGVYNQDLSGNAMLIEFGGVDNTFEELYRSADAIADVFSELYWQAEDVDAQVNEN